MASGWRADKAKADLYLPAIRVELCRGLSDLIASAILEATPERDQLENTDLVLRIDEMTFAVRVRDKRYLAKYANEVTFRYGRAERETEWSKMLAGWGDYFFYAFGDPTTHSLLAGRILRLDPLRQAVAAGTFRVPRAKWNFDQSSTFLPIPVETLPPGVVVHEFDNTTQEAAE